MMKWLRNLFGVGTVSEAPQRPEPSFLEAEAFDEGDTGTVEWSSKHNDHLLSITNAGQTIEWTPKERGEGDLPPVWVPATTLLHLHSGRFRWDFKIEEMAEAQIGVGFMILWDVGPDWGFFGYLGASNTAWSYDPSTGDVVTATESIQGGLPRFTNMRSGTVSVELNLPRHSAGTGKFVIDDIESHEVTLPEGAVILPAACFLRETQRITLENFHQS